MRNGAALRTCHLISSSRSRARDGTFSNLSRDTFATLSGIASATRFGRVPIRSNTRRSAAPAVRGSLMFDAFNPGITVPAGSASTACPVTDSGDSRAATLAADTRCGAISTATVAGAAERNDLFNKGDLVDFAKRGEALQYLLHSRLAQESHAFFVCGFLDFR